ncbi:MAG: DUF4244 domain-containing protein [Bifidobacteriaceae bacterium]|nr:DUF4244 domain-containing protein [Bifidobacteriaceae bacterium]
MKKIYIRAYARVQQQVDKLSERITQHLKTQDKGAITAEYAIVLVAAAGFAALLAVILKSDAVREALANLVKNALDTA